MNRPGSYGCCLSSRSVSFPALWSSSIFTSSSVLKVLLRRLRCRTFLLPGLIIRIFLPKPYTDRDRESQLLYFSQPFCCGSRCSAAPLKRHLRLRRAYLIVQRQCFRQFQYLLVQERHAHFQRIRHTPSLSPFIRISCTSQRCMSTYCIFRHRIFSLLPGRTTASSAFLDSRLTSLFSESGLPPAP